MSETFTGVTHIGVVLDESGSMDPVRDAVIDMYNEWLNGQKAAGTDNTRITLVKFDTDYRPLEQNAPLETAAPLTLTTYAPNATTALYDAVAHVVATIEPLAWANDRVLILIITDGQENASRHTSRQQVLDLITERELRGNWTFTYLSAAPTAWQDATMMGIRVNNTTVFRPDAAGIAAAAQVVTGSTESYRGSSLPQSTSFYAGATQQADDPDDANTPRDLRNSRTPSVPGPK